MVTLASAHEPSEEPHSIQSSIGRVRLVWSQSIEERCRHDLCGETFNGEAICMQPCSALVDKPTE